MYKCIISSHGSHAREYDVTTRSAYKAAQELGRAEYGERVEIHSGSGRVISAAIWDNGSKKYIRVNP